MILTIYLISTMVNLNNHQTSPLRRPYLKESIYNDCNKSDRENSLVTPRSQRRRRTKNNNTFSNSDKFNTADYRARSSGQEAHDNSSPSGEPNNEENKIKSYEDNYPTWAQMLRKQYWRPSTPASLCSGDRYSSKMQISHSRR